MPPLPRLALRSLLLAGLSILVLAAAPAPAADLRFARLNHAYNDLVAEVPTIRQGSASLKLSSPRQTVILRDHRLHLEAVGPRTFDAVLFFEFLGKGWLVVDIEIGALAQRVEDEVVVPLQARSLGARVRIERGATGYVLTPLALPPTLGIDFHSRLGERVLTLCESGAALLFGALDCSWLDSALTRVELPLPPPGQPFFLADQDLTDENRRQLDGLLAASLSAAPAP